MKSPWNVRLTQISLTNSKRALRILPDRSRWVPRLITLSHLGLSNIAKYEHELLLKATEKVREIPGVKLIGTAKEKSAILGFVMEGVHPHDIGTILDREGVAVRVGHHCAQPAMKRFGVPATARASFSFYNNGKEIDRLILGLHKVKEVFAL